MSDDRRERIYFTLDSADWHGRSNEGLWAEPISSLTDTAYRLLNSPFFVKGVSYLDVVRAAKRPDGVGLAFSGVIDRSGHSTYMLLVSIDCPKFDVFWKMLEQLGCTYESKTLNLGDQKKILYSVDIPEKSDIYKIYPIFKDGEKNDVWMFQEGNVGHKIQR